MYKITGKQKFGAVYHEGKCLAVFQKGVATTEDAEAAKILKSKGYTVTEEKKEKK